MQAFFGCALLKPCRRNPWRTWPPWGCAVSPESVADVAPWGCAVSPEFVADVAPVGLRHVAGIRGGRDPVGLRRVPVSHARSCFLASIAISTFPLPFFQPTFPLDIPIFITPGQVTREPDSKATGASIW